MRVFVYWNLHLHKWSIKALDGINRGRVIGHARSVDLVGARFSVSEKGRQRVLRERRKNVHAGVAGTLDMQSPFDYGGRVFDPRDGLKVSYNPYTSNTFHERETDKRVPVRAAARVAMRGREVYALGQVE